MAKKKESRKLRVLRTQASKRLKKGKKLTPEMEKAIGSEKRKKK